MKLTDDEMREAWVDSNAKIWTVVNFAFSFSYINSKHQERLEKISNWRNEMNDRWGI